jgi:hypothetical protein
VGSAEAGATEPSLEGHMRDEEFGEVIGDEDDASLLARLHDAFRREQVAPAAVVEAGKAVFALRDLEAELALLVWDSEMQDAAVTVRGAPAPDQARAMTFEHPGLTVELEAEPDGAGTVTLLGQLVPADDADALAGPSLVVLLERDDADSVPLDVDDLGRVLVEHVPAGRARLRVRRRARPDVVTSWFTLALA